ncbi:MAG: DUF6531 domain-containing protein [Pseudomonadota bacterium]
MDAKLTKNPGHLELQHLLRKLTCAWTLVAIALIGLGSNALALPSAEELSIDMVNEVSSRRQTKKIFHNWQNPYEGVQVGHTNLATGHLTFFVRDAVAIDKMPVVIGRVFDSRVASNGDFGPNWKLSLTESLYVDRRSGQVVFHDATGSSYNLLRGGDGTFRTESGVQIEATLSGRIATVTSGSLTRRFVLSSDKTYTLREVESSNGGKISLSYRRGRLRSISNERGLVARIARNPTGQISGISGPRIGALSYEYDASGLLIGVSAQVEDDRRTWAFLYNSSRHLEQVIAPDGSTVADFEFDVQGRVTRSNVQGRLFEYSFSGSTTRVTNAIGQTARFEVVSNGDWTITGFGGLSVTVQFGPTGKPIGLVAPDTELFSFEYDRAGRLSGVNKMFGTQSSTSLVYTDDSRLTSIERDGTSLASFSYHDSGLLAQASDSRGTRSYQWGRQGGVTGIENRGGETVLRRNPRGLITSIESWSGQSVELSYSASGRAKSIVFSDGSRADYTYDSYGFREQSSYSNGVDVDFAYDSKANLKSVTFAESDIILKEDTYEIGENNELLSISSTSGPTMAFAYDGIGRIANIETGSRLLEVEYDVGSQVERISVDGVVTYQTSALAIGRDEVVANDKRTDHLEIAHYPGFGVYGDIDTLVYSRPVAALSGLLVFDDQSMRFFVADFHKHPTEARIQSSLRRQGLEMNRDGEFMSAWYLDKPSNMLFVPPEYAAVNCYVCIGVVALHSLAVNGASSTTVNVGESVQIDSSAGVEGCYEGGFSFIDMVVSTGAGSQNYNSAPGSLATSFITNNVSAVYNSPGVYSSRSTVNCSCNIFTYSEREREVTVTPSPPGLVTVTYTMFIPLNHVKIPVSSPTPLGGLYSADSKLVHVPGENSYRIQQTLIINTATKTVASLPLSGVTKGYLPTEQHLTPGSCFRNDCTSCKYPALSFFPNEPFVAVGQCVVGASQCNELAEDMETIVASVTGQTQSSVTVSFSGNPDNACEGSFFGLPLALDISWDHSVTIAWDENGATYDFDLEHDGFPAHQISIGSDIIYVFDPVANGKSPASLGFPKDVSAGPTGPL